jgi:hypothetical protein
VAARIALSASSDSVLAVLVTYEQNLAGVAAWAALASALREPPEAQPLQLRQVLIYDNSPTARSQPPSALPGIHYWHDPENGGTAGAYTRALEIARKIGCPWLLLLDQDTELPDNYFGLANRFLASWSGSPPAALLPHVLEGSRPVSPAHMTRLGSIRPMFGDAKGDRHLTGIASGSLVRVDALSAAGPIPHPLWLDYVDHWLFQRLHAAGGAVLAFDARLQHRLSVNDVASLSPERVRSILSAESCFVRGLPWLARATHPLRLLGRALRYALLRPVLAREVLMHLVGREASAMRTRRP